MAQSHDNRAGRRTAEVTDDFDLLPPTTAVRGDVPVELVEAVDAALAAEPNAVDDPKLRRDDDGPVLLDCSFNELPVSAPDGTVDGWLAPYRAREDFLAALDVDGYDVEAVNDNRLGFYEGSR